MLNKNIFHPERFQGVNKRKQYFEGWYFKCLNESGDVALALIPGVAMDSVGNKQSFIQVLDGKDHTATYHKFDFESSQYDPNSFDIRIADNHFNAGSISLNLPELKGELQFTQHSPWPGSLLSPGIMGPFAFVPLMECYHGIVSMDHSISGSLQYRGQSISFDMGRGYIEKDWGKSFPSAYIWLQANHFSRERISLKVSVANIPWLGSSFVGFIGGLLIDDKLYQFTTYNGSRIQQSYADKEKVLITLENKRYRLEINAQRDHATELASPIAGHMDGRISESMTSAVDIRLIQKNNGQLLLSDHSQHAALEVAGLIKQIMI